MSHTASVEFMPDLLSTPSSKMALTYLCNEMSVDPYESFKLQVLEKILFEGVSSIFYKELIQTGIADSYCPGYGYDNTTR